MRRLVLLLGLLAVLAVVGWRAVSRVLGFRAAEAVCAATERGDWPAALAVEVDFDAPGPSAERAAECRCLALLESDRKPECVDLMEGLLATRSDWLPSPLPTAFVAEDRRRRGDLTGAAELAHRGALAYPESMVLLYLELDTRSALEGERPVLEEMARRLPSAGAAAPLLALRIAERFIERDEWAEAAELLGETPPADPELAPLWFELRVHALAGLGRPEAVRRTFDLWRARGGDPDELAVRYALLTSFFTLPDPERTRVELLAEAVRRAARLDVPDLRQTVTQRYIRALVAEGEFTRALEALDRAEREFGALRGLDRGEILRTRRRREAPRASGAATPGTIVFRLPGRVAGDRLAITPGGDQPVDAAYVERPVPADGRLRIERAAGVAPQRWVARDAQGRTVGSGAVWPVPGATVDFEIERRPPAAATAPSPAASGSEDARPPADGRRRIVFLILDSADWRLVRYLVERGDLPTVERLIERGTRGVMLSDPPFTAVAVEAIAVPAKRGVSSFLEMMHQLGSEFETMNFVGANPFGALRWVVGTEEGLFETLGAGDLAVVNMLRSFGPLQVGRRGEVTGPYDARRQLEGFAGSRELSDEELALQPALDSEPLLALARELAADFDTVVRLVEEGELDLVALRVDSLDLFTHSHFPAVATTGQDDGRRRLYDFYRAIDFRLAEVWRALDADDLLVVVSDHGSLTALEHDPNALFLAAGGGVGPGRLPGRPEIRGLGRMLAELFGVDTDWPETALSAWAESLPPAPRGGG